LALVLVLASCGALGQLHASPAAATFSGGNGQIAAEWSYTDRGGENQTKLVFVDLDGFESAPAASVCSRPEFGTPSGRCPGDPAYSANGTKLAFGQDGRLAIAGPTGDSIVRLPALTESDEDPAWSPRGDRVAFTGKQRGQQNVYVVHADGTGLRQLTSHGGAFPAWSGRGVIAYVAQGVIYRLDARGHRTRLARGSEPDWSPSGRSIAYSYKGRVYTLAVRRGAHRELVARRATGPVFSPNGKSIAFLTSSTFPSVYTKRVHGGRARVVVRGGELPVGSTFVSYGALAWQPIG
jgi:hypothetical protein